MVRSHIEYCAGNYGEDGRCPRQFSVLHETVDRLMGDGGIDLFYLNDLVPEAAEYAARSLLDHCRTRGFDLEIRVLPGDILRMVPPQTYSAHMKNPEPMLLEKMRCHPLALTRVVQSSLTGLEVHTMYPDMFLDAALMWDLDVDPLGEGIPYVRGKDGREVVFDSYIVKRFHLELGETVLCPY